MVGEAAADGKQPFKTAFEKVRRMTRARKASGTRAKGSLRVRGRRKATRVLAGRTNSKSRPHGRKKS
jgi:hypothetical protein